MFAPLTGVTVVDCTHVLAGPYCTQLLANLGAEVIKVEPVSTGDLTRWTGPVDALNEEGRGLAFCTQNTDKASLAVDLTRPEGAAIVRALAGRCDVFVENFRPGVADRLGIGWETLAADPGRVIADGEDARRRGLVYVSITAYGQDGPIGHRPAYDHVVQAMSGIMETTGTDETGPIKVGGPIIDYATGLKAALAAVAAVVEQRRTGDDQRVDVAMLDSALLLMANTLAATATTGERPAKLGNEAASRSPSAGTFATADGLLAIAANNERQVTDLCRAIDRPDLLDDQRFASRRARSTNVDAFRAILVDRLATRTAAEWELALDRAGVPASRVRSLDELLDEGQPAARELLRPVEVGTTTAAIPTAGFKVNGQVPGPALAPAMLGADTERLLADLGYDRADVAGLVEAGVVGPSSTG